MHACYVHFRPMLNAYPAIQQWRLLNSVNRATPTLTKDLSFYGLVRRTPNIETYWVTWGAIYLALTLSLLVLKT